MNKIITKHPASFRDPSGYVFYQNKAIYRGINANYMDNYELLINSGLYERLIDCNYLISHEEIDGQFENFAKIIKPQHISFISYAYEWSFTQFKDAALMVLDIQEMALNYGMTLKDASIYNMQFKDGAPILIDTLSFEKYVAGKPWVAYKQFCQHFLAPLVLMSKVDIRLPGMLKNYIDGIPLDLASTLLPRKTWFNLGILMHIHLHAKSLKKYQSTSKELGKEIPKISQKSLIGILHSLRMVLKNLSWNPEGTEWADYYNDTNYSSKSFDKKECIIQEYLGSVKPNTVWDLGANNGYFSRLAQAYCQSVLSFDIDPAAVEQNFRNLKKEKNTNLLPLLMDFVNPSPSIGWGHAERDSLMNRGPADCVMALALIHHLVISNNVPFEKIADFFSKICHFLIIEFVPNSDSQVKRIMRGREEIFSDYTQETFENAFINYFDIIRYDLIDKDCRILYLMQKRNSNE